MENTTITTAVSGEELDILFDLYADTDGTFTMEVLPARTADYIAVRLTAPGCVLFRLIKLLAYRELLDEVFTPDELIYG